MRDSVFSHLNRAFERQFDAHLQSLADIADEPALLDDATPQELLEALAECDVFDRVDELLGAPHAGHTYEVMARAIEEAHQ